MEKVPQFFLSSTENEAPAGMKNRAIQTHSLTLACVKHVEIAGSGIDDRKLSMTKERIFGSTLKRLIKM